MRPGLAAEWRGPRSYPKNAGEEWCGPEASIREADAREAQWALAERAANEAGLACRPHPFGTGRLRGLSGVSPALTHQPVRHGRDSLAGGTRIVTAIPSMIFG